MASDVAGFVLHPVDLAVNKLLALVGRDEPRDFLDILDVHDTVLPLCALVWAAAGKDPGHTPGSLLSLLQRRGKYHAQDFARLNLAKLMDLPALKQRWLDALDEAHKFVESRPPEEMGCLYYSPTAASFVGNPDESKDAVPHFGRPGGVIPSLVDRSPNN